MSCITLILTTLLLGSIADAQTDYRDDFLSSFLTIPGVQPGRMGLSDFVVRGGDPDQNLVLLDGIPVYSPVHLSGTLAACPAQESMGQAFMTNSSLPASAVRLRPCFISILPMAIFIA